MSKKKFNVGDLVCLSAYGKARDYNDRLVGHWGIVIGTNFRKPYPYKIRWLSKPDNWEDSFHEREIKFFKKNT
jgi:hypothetical protein